MTIAADELRAVPLFAGLADDLAWVAGAGRELRLALGEPLFEEGGTDVGFFVLLAGRL